MRTLVLGLVGCVACSSNRVTEPVVRQEGALVLSPWTLSPGATPKSLQGDHTATLVTATKLAVLGGSTSVDNTPTDAAYMITHDPAAHAFELKPVGKLGRARAGHTATLLANGKILVAGGYVDAAGTIHDSAELIDPTTATTTPTKPMLAARSRHGAVLLPGGKVLVMGGRGPDILSSAEIYDPATGTWTAAPPMSEPRYFVTATTLKDGRVLVVGGGGGVTTETFDPGSLTWKPAGKLSETRIGHVAALLPSGKVLVGGGFPILSSTEIFDPATSGWSAGPPMPTPRGNATATVLASGRVMVAGGRLEFTPLAYVDHYDESTNSWRAGSPMLLPHTLHTATLFPSGDVFVLGSVFAEKFSPVATGQGCARDADCVSGFCVDEVCCATACKGACERCDTNTAKGSCTAVSGAFNHCEPGNTCIQNVCTPSAGTTCSADRLGVVSKTGETRSCAPFVCDNSVGACGTECVGTLDCASGYACNIASRRCEAAASPAGSDGGCATAGTPAGPAPWIVLLASVVALSSRRSLLRPQARSTRSPRASRGA